MDRQDCAKLAGARRPLFQKERLTLGQASRLAGMNQLEFQRLLAGRQIPIHYGVSDFEQDLQTLRELGRL